MTPLLRAGDAVLMDACCLHGGGANSLRPRRLFHLSFCRSGFVPGGFASYAQSLAKPDGERRVAGGSARHTLDDAERWLGDG